MAQAELELRVRYGETDRMGFVYYASYLPWMIAAARSLCPQNPHPHAFDVKYITPCGYDDLVRVNAQVDSSGEISITISKNDVLSIEGTLYYQRGQSPKLPKDLKYGNTWQTPITVRAHEVQEWGIPAVIALSWFEASRNEHLRAVGLTYAECERRGVWLPVVYAWAELIAGVEVGEEVIVESQAIKEGVRVGFACRVLNAKGKDLVRGGTLHVCMTPEGRILKPMVELTYLLEFKAG